MDVHPPHEPIHTWKDFFIHLITITIGLFIALSLESCTEWVHHKHMVREAEENLTAEIRANQKELAGMETALQAEQGNLDKALSFLQMRRHNQPIIGGQLTLNYTLANLKGAAWQTATATATLAYMPYSDVQKYAGVYDLQSQFLRIQDSAVDKQLALISSVLIDEDPTKLTPADAQAAIQQLRTVQSQLGALKQIGAALDKQYTDALRH